MKYLVTADEMREYDNNTIERIGVPALVLMERAALAVRDEILRREEARGTILIAVGCGNNGADGLALARLLAEQNWKVSVLECGDPARGTESYKTQRKILQYYEVTFLKDISAVQDTYDYVADGIFGVGLTRPVTGAYAEVIHRLNQIKGCKVAIDIPSGVDGTTGAVLGCGFLADVTVTFGFGKRGLYLYPGTEYAGNVVTAGIGIDEHGFFGRVPEMFTYEGNPTALLPARRRDGNKGTFGKVLLIAGWEHMAGAAVMCAKGILRTGAGMVKVFCEESNRGILQSAVPEAMYGSRESLAEDLKWADVAVCGPGLGKSGEAGEVLRQLLENTRKTAHKLVLDADALNLISEDPKLQALVSGAVMTPHVGELARLTGQTISSVKSAPVEVAKAAALDYDSVMVCKDARTLVCEKGSPFYLNTTGNSGMATAGSGDVLAGMIGGLLAQGMKPFEAACVGVYLHGLAGDGAAEKYSEYGVTATGILAQIEAIMKGS